MIRIEHLRKAYPEVTPLQDVNVEIRDGDVISVIGPSGTGKSTLLRCINLLEKPTSGRILVNGEDITAPGCDVNRVRRKMGMVFQSFNLFSHLTVIENLMLAPTDLLGRSRQEAYDAGMRLLKMVGLADRALQYPDQLSGGQKQRVAIARTLAMDPDTILFDEPTSALDPTMVGEVQAVIRELAGTGKTLLIVTHEMAFARAICSRVFFMDEGGIYEDGTPEQIFEHPQREKTRRFIRRLKVLEIRADAASFDFPRAAAEIERYCSVNQMPPRLGRRMRLAFEEMVQELLLPRPGIPRILATAEYEPDTGALWRVQYGGAPWDVTREGDPLSLSVLRGICAEIRYTALQEGEWTNQAELRLREEAAGTEPAM